MLAASRRRPIRCGDGPTEARFTPREQQHFCERLQPHRMLPPAAAARSIAARQFAVPRATIRPLRTLSQGRFRGIALAMTVITENHALAEFCARQQGADFVAVDTEFMRERTYWPILCLVQVAGPEEAAAIDALAPGIDLAPLLALMADPSARSRCFMRRGRTSKFSST